ncbi:hypothetical protein AGLY_006048 [Aphis glycines]|uniref:Uncharacterized protein n=1 Tax=Aphis glycines TaxID=307491 RepID=A0A6G0TUY9_APHGL|nr:hypothetical protein AGLY_006048 [Aphis glycines]
MLTSIVKPDGFILSICVIKPINVLCKYFKMRKDESVIKRVDHTYNKHLVVRRHFGRQRGVRNSDYYLKCDWTLLVQANALKMISFCDGDRVVLYSLELLEIRTRIIAIICAQNVTHVRFYRELDAYTTSIKRLYLKKTTHTNYGSKTSSRNAQTFLPLRVSRLRNIICLLIGQIRYFTTIESSDTKYTLTCLNALRLKKSLRFRLTRIILLLSVRRAHTYDVPVCIHYCYNIPRKNTKRHTVFLIVFAIRTVCRHYKRQRYKILNFIAPRAIDVHNRDVHNAVSYAFRVYLHGIIPTYIDDNNSLYTTKADTKAYLRCRRAHIYIYIHCTCVLLTSFFIKLISCYVFVLRVYNGLRLDSSQD